MNSITKSIAAFVVTLVAFGMTFSFAGAISMADLDAYIAKGFSAEWIMANVTDGGSSSMTSCTVYGLPGVMGVQQAVNQLGYTPALVVDGVAGPMTKAGIMWAQSMLGVAADGAWGQITNGAYVAYITANCDEGDDSSDDSSDDKGSDLEGGAGSVDSYDLVSGYNNEEVGEGQDDQVVAGLEVEASNDSDLEVMAVRLVFAQGTATNDQFDDFASEVGIWFDGEKVADVDADEFDEDNSYSKTITLDSGVIIGAGDTEDILVSVSGANNIDSGDLGDTWTVDFRQVRFRDASDTVISEDPGTGTRTFSFESFASSANTKFKITTDDDDDEYNEAHVIEVDDTNETDNVTVLSFSVTIEGDSDVELDDLPVNFDVTGAANVDDLISQTSLWIDGDEVQSENIGTAVGADETITFADMDLVLDAGEKYQFEVKVDIIETDSTSDNGDTISAQVSATERAAADINDENGDDLDASDRTGTAVGEAHVIYDEGIRIEFVSADAEVTTPGDPATGGSTDVGTFTIKFKATAFGADARLDKSSEDFVVDGTGDAGEGVVFSVTDASATVVTSNLASSSTDSEDTANTFELDEDHARTFTLTVVVEGDDDLVEVSIDSINWGTATNDTNADFYTFNLDEYKTGDLFLNVF